MTQTYLNGWSGLPHPRSVVLTRRSDIKVAELRKNESMRTGGMHLREDLEN